MKITNESLTFEKIYLHTIMKLEALPKLDTGLMDTNVSFLILDFEINLCLQQHSVCTHWCKGWCVEMCKIDINAHIRKDIFLSIHNLKRPLSIPLCLLLKGYLLTLTHREHKFETLFDANCSRSRVNERILRCCYTSQKIM